MAQMSMHWISQLPKSKKETMRIYNMKIIILKILKWLSYIDGHGPLKVVTCMKISMSDTPTDMYGLSVFMQQK